MGRIALNHDGTVIGEPVPFTPEAYELLRKGGWPQSYTVADLYPAAQPKGRVFDLVEDVQCVPCGQVFALGPDTPLRCPACGIGYFRTPPAAQAAPKA